MSSINEAMNLTMEKLRDMIDVNTVVGKPVTTPDGTTLIPVSKVSFGFASGGTDGKDLRFGAGSGAGCCARHEGSTAHLRRSTMRGQHRSRRRNAAGLVD